jgi:putative N6-adenine-specific DNA methylase
MCGSGTLLIEAAMIAQNIPPRINVSKFSIQNWDTFDAELWNSVKRELKENIEPTSTRFIGSDISDESVEMATSASKEMGLSNIEIKQCDIIDLENELSSGVLISNPPYGERLQKDNIVEFYKEIGDLLKSEFTGFEAWIMSSNFEALKFIGLRPSRKIPLRNGALDCKLQKYELYSGSKKAKKQVVV